MSYHLTSSFRSTTARQISVTLGVPLRESSRRKKNDLESLKKSSLNKKQSLEGGKLRETEYD